MPLASRLRASKRISMCGAPGGHLANQVPQDNCTRRKTHRSFCSSSDTGSYHNDRTSKLVAPRGPAVVHQKATALFASLFSLK